MKRARGITMSDVKIFISCHKPVSTVENGVIKPVQVGAALAKTRLDGMAYYDDGAEDNISRLNRKYCELTAQYYVYKHVDADYYGFMHYRRYLSFSKKRGALVAYTTKNIGGKFVKNYGLDEKTVKSVVEKYDMIMPKAHFILISNRFMYKLAPTGFVKDLDFCLEVIKRDYPQMYKTAKRYLRSPFSYTCNMFVMKKELFLDYSAWLFDILSKFDESVDCSGYTPEQGRVSGYLGERLLGIYFSYIKSLKKYKTKTVSRVFVRDTAKK